MGTRVLTVASSRERSAFGRCCGERLAELAGDEREVLVEPLDAAELADELDGRLLADAGHAGDIVDGCPP